MKTYRRKRQISKRCPTCTKSFTTNRPSLKQYCSDSCRVRASQMRLRSELETLRHEKKKADKATTSPPDNSSEE